MYRHLSIKNFRSIASADLALSPFTVVVGPNGAGKSNLVDALVFLRDIMFDAETAVASRGGIGGIVRWSPTRPFDLHLRLRVATTPTSASTDFLEHDIVVSAGRSGDWKFKSEHIERRGHSFRTTCSRKGNTIVWDDRVLAEDVPTKTSAMVWARQVIKLGSIMRAALMGVHRYRLNPETMRQPQLASDQPRLVESGSNIASAIRKFSEDRRMAEVLIPMSRIVPGLTAIVPIVAGRHMLLEFHQQQRSGTAKFTASELSDGALRSLGIIVAARQMLKNELLIIEEPEANVHVGAARLIFEVLHEASERCSVVITTHSPELLDAASADSIVVCAYQDGVTRIGPLAEEQRELVRSGLFRIAELMRADPLRIEGDAPPLASA